jgi:putative intracellular protease/amidase
MNATLRFASIILVVGALGLQSAVAQHTDTPRAAILLFDGAEIIDFAGPYEVFGQAGFDVYTVSADGRDIVSAMDLSVGVDHDFTSAPQADILLIPGGNVRDVAGDAATLDFIRTQSALADHVLSVCTGSFVLAATGMLDGKTATTFHGSFDSMASAFPEIEIVRDRRWVDTGKLVTSAGLSSGIDAALHVVGEVRGVDIARAVAMNLEYDWSPSDREGFIRGLQADRHLRLPSGELPGDAQMHVMGGFGDDRRWQTMLHVVSALSPDAFMDQLRALVAGDEVLRPVNTGPDTVAWQHTDEDGSWQLTLDVGGADTDALAAAFGGGFMLVGELRALD